jgi:hypothetical protein
MAGIALRSGPEGALTWHLASMFAIRLSNRALVAVLSSRAILRLIRSTRLVFPFCSALVSAALSLGSPVAMRASAARRRASAFGALTQSKWWS